MWLFCFCFFLSPSSPISVPKILICWVTKLDNSCKWLYWCKKPKLLRIVKFTFRNTVAFFLYMFLHLLANFAKLSLYLMYEALYFLTIWFFFFPINFFYLHSKLLSYVLGKTSIIRGFYSKSFQLFSLIFSCFLARFLYFFTPEHRNPI